MPRTGLLGASRAIFLLLVACGGGGGGGGGAAPPASSTQTAADEPALEASPAPDAEVDSSSQPETEPGRVSEDAQYFDPVLEAIGLFAHMARVMAAAGSDCDQMARDLDRWADDTQTKRTQVNQALERAGQFEKLQQRMSKRKDLIESVQSSATQCGKMASFQAAWKKAVSN